MKYAWDDLIKTFFLTPIPLLIIAATIFIVANHEYRLSAVLAILIGHLMVYVVFCVIFAPVGLLLSWLLNKYRCINLQSIFISTLLLVVPFGLLLNWMHTGQIAEKWWKMYWHLPTLLFVSVISLSYFFILKWLHAKRRDIFSSENIK